MKTVCAVFVKYAYKDTLCLYPFFSPLLAGENVNVVTPTEAAILDHEVKPTSCRTK